MSLPLSFKWHAKKSQAKAAASVLLRPNHCTSNDGGRMKLLDKTWTAKHPILSVIHISFPLILWIIFSLFMCFKLTLSHLEQCQYLFLLIKSNHGKTGYRKNEVQLLWMKFIRNIRDSKMSTRRRWSTKGNKQYINKVIRHANQLWSTHTDCFVATSEVGQISLITDHLHRATPAWVSFFYPSHWYCGEGIEWKISGLLMSEHKWVLHDYVQI